MRIGSIVRAVCVIAGSAVLAVPAWAAADSGKASGSASVTIAAVGDTMLGNTPDLPPSPGTYLNAVTRVLDRGAQIVFGNLEGTLTTATDGKCGPAGHPSQNCFA